MKIVIVNGQGASGKTTFEQMVQKIAKERNKKVEILSTITYIKEIATEIGWGGEKTKESRRFLSDLKDALTHWNDSPYQYIRKQIEILENENVDLLFIDCREPKEIKRFVEDYHALTLLVKRFNKVVIVGNHADDCVYDYDYDIIIDNSRGLNELK